MSAAGDEADRDEPGESKTQTIDGIASDLETDYASESIIFSLSYSYGLHII